MDVVTDNFQQLWIFSLCSACVELGAYILFVFHVADNGLLFCL